MKKILFLAAVCLMVGCHENRLVSQLDEAVRAVFPRDDEPGAMVVVVDENEVIFCQAYGLADMETHAPISAETRFNIASCSKQFTAVAVLQLAAEGRVDLQAPVTDYFPEYTAPCWRDVKVSHLLSHSSGIPDGRGYLSREQKVRGDEDLATEYLAWLDTLHFAPGTDYEYINPTFVLLGKLVERVTGQTFVAYAQEHILEPTGMHASFYFDPALDEPGAWPVATSHAYEYADVTDMPEERTATAAKDEVKEWYEYDYGEETFFATRPDGGLYSSVYDLLRWEADLQAQVADTTRFAELLREAMSPHTLVSGSTWSDYQNRPDTWYGYGWFVEPEKGCIYHTGDNGGYKILVARYPARKGLILILANRADWDRYALKTQIEQLVMQ